MELFAQTNLKKRIIWPKTYILNEEMFPENILSKSLIPVNNIHENEQA